MKWANLEIHNFQKFTQNIKSQVSCIFKETGSMVKTTYVTQNYTITKEQTTVVYNMDESHRENSKEKS